MDDNKFLNWWVKYHEKGQVRYITRGAIYGLIAGILLGIAETLIIGYDLIFSLTSNMMFMLIVGIFSASFAWNYYEKRYGKLKERKATSNNSRPYGSQTEVGSTKIHLR